MKRFLPLLVCTLALVSMSSGQISVSYSSFSAMFNTGGPIRFYLDTLATTVNVGHRGGPQTFDFSGLTLFQSSQDTIKLVTAYPFLAPRFDPTAITFKISQAGAQYEQPILILQSSSMTQTGHYRYWTADSARVRHTSPAELFLKFPVTLGDSVRTTVQEYDTLFVTGSASQASTGSFTEDYVVDAYGTLLLPGGKSYACLRLRSVEQLPNNYKEFRFITETGGMLFIGTVNTEPDSGIVNVGDPPQYVINPTVTSVQRVAELPVSTALEQNYPNPFNPETAISFQLSALSRVRLSVYDLLGREVARLVDGTLVAGPHRATWNAAAFPSGVYFYKLETDGFAKMRKMVLVK